MTGNLNVEGKATAAHVLRSASDFGCSGLVAGHAIQVQSGKRVLADNVQKEDGPFLCPKCRIPAVVHKDRGSGRVDHFAHNAPLSPIVPHGESATHLAAKHEICDALRRRWPEGKWEVERTIPKNDETKTPELRPDISGNIEKQPLVIEVQWSTLSLATILRRSVGYFKMGKPVLWVLPLEKPIEGEFRPRSFERYLHSIYYGRVYYWQRGDGIHVTPIHFVPVERWIDIREWRDSEGEQTGGGHTKKLHLLKTASAERKINISDDFERHKRGEFAPRNEKRKVPQLRLWKDKLSVWWDENHEELAEREWEKEGPEQA